jgi:hypothetical protein
VVLGAEQRLRRRECGRHALLLDEPAQLGDRLSYPRPALTRPREQQAQHRVQRWQARRLGYGRAHHHHEVAREVGLLDLHECGIAFCPHTLFERISRCASTEERAVARFMQV